MGSDVIVYQWRGVRIHTCFEGWVDCCVGEYCTMADTTKAGLVDDELEWLYQGIHGHGKTVRESQVAFERRASEYADRLKVALGIEVLADEDDALPVGG